MTLRQIHYFLEAYEQQSIVKAAQKLFVSRPVISRALSDLEDEMGFPLFLRSGNSITPTEQGQLIYRTLKSCEATVGESIRRVREGAGRTSSRHVKLGVLNSSGSWYYQQIIIPFTRRYPDISVNIIGIQVEEGLNAVVEGKVDMAIAPLLPDQPVNTRLIREHFLYEVEFVLCVPPGAHMEQRSITIEECAVLPQAIFDNLPAPRFNMENKVLSTRKLDLIYLAVSQGYAYAVLPTELTVEHPELRTVPFSPPIKSRTFLLWNDLLPHSKAFDLLRGFICEMDFQSLRERFSQPYHLPEPAFDSER